MRACEYVERFIYWCTVPNVDGYCGGSPDIIIMI